MPNIRFVVRPKSILGTPKDLAHALGARSRFYPNPKRDRILDYKKDFLFLIPRMENIQNAPQNLMFTRQFWLADKAGQRYRLSLAGIPVPETATTKLRVVGWPQGRFIVRPMSHSQGRNYRVTDDPSDFQEGLEYISQVFPKTREYRQIFIYGEPLVLLRKKNPDDEAGRPDPESPWNHTQGMYYQTVHDTEKSPLNKNHPDCIRMLRENPVIKQSHIVGVDILYKKDQWVVCEFNSCPALTIPENMLKIADFIRNH